MGGRTMPSHNICTQSLTTRDAAHVQSTAMVAVGDFDQSAAALLLEEEVREAVSGTVGTASGATAVGLTLTGAVDRARTRRQYAMSAS